MTLDIMIVRQDHDSGHHDCPVRIMTLGHHDCPVRV